MDPNSFITLQIDVLMSSCNILIWIHISTITIQVNSQSTCHQRNQNTGKLAIQPTPVTESVMYNIPLTTGIGIDYLKSIFGISSNSQVRMESRNQKIEKNPLAAFIASFIFSLIILTTLIYQLHNYLLNPKPLQAKATHFNTQNPTANELVNENPLAPHQHLEPPQPTEQKVIDYFNPRFQGIPDLQHLRIQVRENMDAIFEGAALPWPEIMEKGFGYTTMAEIDREVGLQRRRIQDSEQVERDGNAKGAHPRDKDDKGDTPGWMLALFEHGHGKKNPDASTSPAKKEEEKSTCPICTDELPTKAAIAKPCKHRFCTTCLEDWMAHLRGMGKRQKVRCPVCGVRIRRVGRGGGLMDRVNEALRRR
ncbi:uncharacterized protein Bfra_006608 [Botrytis fragariae]|uniref:RING-type domain-containing protein n=1 Tax=Botrytis fragariae TaxID=1964551 RepID=A0A8H6B4R6_9HELO|nr:uncharacterized protein Bfra_006608 [Botrytis fragariae]KAF5879399.1 hypothetical protein Bfra_006608 [Botrytis fragariae]